MHCRSNFVQAIQFGQNHPQKMFTDSSFKFHLDPTFLLVVLANLPHPRLHWAGCELDGTLKPKNFSVSQVSKHISLFCSRKSVSQISSPGHLHSLSTIPPCTRLLSARPGNHDDDRDDQEDHDHHEGF